MNAERLLAQFERISDAPDAIARLRRFILDLAVRGKLVEQDPEEIDERTFCRLAPQAKPCDLIPDFWLYVPLAGLLSEDTRNGYSRKPDDALDGVPILRISAGTARPDGLVAEEESKLISGIDDKLLDQYEVRTGDLLACRFNGNKDYVGRLSLFRGYLRQRFIYPDKLIRIRLAEELAEPSFLRWISGADLVREEIETKCATTVGNWGISAGKLKTCLVPLPPLAEQHRIVAKVDELMALCDQLEAARQKREQGRERLLASTLQRLNQPAEDPASFRQDASFALQVLPSLTTTSAQIKQLRQTILNLAVRGKLVEQDPEDEPAEELLAGVAEEKVRKSSRESRIAGGLLPNDRNYVQPFSLQASWEWTTLEDYALDVSTGPFGSMLHQSDYIVGGVPVVNPSHMVGGRICSDPKVTVSPGMAEQLESYKLAAGDIVMARRGEVGRAALVTEEEEGWLCGTGSFIVRFIPEILRAYVLLFLSTDLARGYLISNAIGTTMTNLKHGILKKTPIPLPPLAEQHRIVAKVDALMALCDQLEQQLNQADQQRRRLLEAVLAEALGGRLPTGQEESHAAIA
jgi:type I restriction enzyme S subunit